jgi:enoyl-CoA hydratase/carnithine racemase
MSEPLVLVDVGDGIATVTLNRPQAMNALSRALRAEIVRTLDDGTRQDPCTARSRWRTCERGGLCAGVPGWGAVAPQ